MTVKDTESVAPDAYINSLFENTNFGSDINSSPIKKRELLAKTLKNQVDGYWSGHTAYHIALNGGFLHDAKSGKQKRLTALGRAYIEAFDKPEEVHATEVYSQPYYPG